MARVFNRLLPHPVLTLLLAIVWVLLRNELSAGMVVFGFVSTVAYARFVLRGDMIE